MAKRQMTEEDRAKKGVSKIRLYQKVFSGPDGHAVLLDLMSTHYMLRTSYSKDPLEMAANEGERQVVLRILSMMNMDTSQLEERIKEHVRENV